MALAQYSIRRWQQRGPETMKLFDEIVDAPAKLWQNYQGWQDADRRTNNKIKKGKKK